MIGVCLGQLGNVISDLATLVLLARVEQLFDLGLCFFKLRNHKVFGHALMNDLIIVFEYLEELLLGKFVVFNVFEGAQH